MTVTAAQVRDLREKTGAGMMDAKGALTEANGDMDKAMEILRQRGMAIDLRLATTEQIEIGTVEQQ